VQVALDRGEQLGWLESNEIIAERSSSRSAGFLLFLCAFAHDLKPFIQLRIFRERISSAAASSWL